MILPMNQVPRRISLMKKKIGGKKILWYYPFKEQYKSFATCFPSGSSGT